MPPRVLRIGRLVADLARAEAFYRRGLGFRLVSRGRVPTGAAAGPGRQAVLRLGDDEVALVRPDRPGARYPEGSRSDDLWFQHLAIVVADMDAATAILEALAPPGISRGGPQRLPPRNGGVEAFKFRDPDGHPLELIWFPPGQGRDCWHRPAAGRVFLGIDHSALAVRSTARSLRFYRRLGFRVAARSANAGPAQSRLDRLPHAAVQVTSLRGAAEGPGLELLAYRPPGRPAARIGDGDIAADWVTLRPAGRGRPPGLLRDPDGHRMLMAPVSPSRPRGR